MSWWHPLPWNTGRAGWQLSLQTELILALWKVPNTDYRGLHLAVPLPALSISEQDVIMSRCHSFQYFPLFVAEILTFIYVYQMYKIIFLWFCIGDHLHLWERKWKLHEKEMAGQLRNYLCYINRGLISILIFALRYFLCQSCDLNANLAH